MSIDWTSFTPLMALLGGGLIGLAAGMFFLLHGQIIGANIKEAEFPTCRI